MISGKIEIALQTGVTEHRCVCITVWGSHDSDNSYCLLSHIWYIFTNVSEEPAASFFKVALNN
jgi:hypothetical protein